MRIISGRFKGRKFYPPADKWPTRPTTDYAKEGLFNILQNQLNFPDEQFLDLFGGTGNHSYEFISRGCNDVTYVDKHGPAVAFVKKVAAELGIDDKIKIVKDDVARFIKSSNRSYSYIFAGPPYPLPWLNTIPDLIFASSLLKKDGLFVLEHNPEHNFTNHPNFVTSRNYGTTIFSFFEHKEENIEV